MKSFRIELNVTSTHWESCFVEVEAETEQEARDLFEADPYKYDWDNWKDQDSDIKDWEIDSVEEDKQMTIEIKKKEEK